MRKILSVFVVLLALSACSSKQEVEQKVHPENLLFEQELQKQVKKEPKKTKQEKSKSLESKKTVVEYKQAEKQLIKELKQRFKEINENQEDVIIQEQEPETVKFSAPENSQDLIESLKQAENSENTELNKSIEGSKDQTVTSVQEKALSVSDNVVLEEKDSLKQEEKFNRLKEIFLTGLLVLFLLACLYVGLKNK